MPEPFQRIGVNVVNQENSSQIDPDVPWRPSRSSIANLLCAILNVNEKKGCSFETELVQQGLFDIRVNDENGKFIGRWSDNIARWFILGPANEDYKQKTMDDYGL